MAKKCWLRSHRSQLEAINCYLKVLLTRRGPTLADLGGRRPTRGEFEGAQPLQCPCGAAAKQRGIKRSGVSGIMNRVTSTKAELEGLRSEATQGVWGIRPPVSEYGIKHTRQPDGCLVCG